MIRHYIDIPSKINNYGNPINNLFGKPKRISTKVSFGFFNYDEATTLNRQVFNHTKHFFILRKSAIGFIAYWYLEVTHQQIKILFENEYARLEIPKKQIDKMILSMVAFAFEVISFSKNNQ